MAASTPPLPHLDARQRAHQHQLVEMPDMGDPERLALELVEAGAERHVEIVEHDFPEMVGVMAFRHHDAGQRRRIGLRILALGFQSPRLHRRPRRRADALVAGEDIVEPFLLQHGNRFFQSIEQVDRRRVGPGAHLVVGDDFLPVPIGAHRRIGLRYGKRLFRHRVEAEAGRQHQPLLRAADRHVDAPGVMLVFQRGEPGNGIDHQQCRMFGPIQRFADFERRGDAAGRCLVVHDHHRLDAVRAIGRELCLDLLHIGPAPPVARQEIDVELEFLGNAEPQHGELAGLGHQHLVARLQRVDDRGFPGAGPRRRIDHDRLFGAEDALGGRHHRKAELGEFGAAMIHAGHVHGPQHPVGYVGRSWNLEKMPSSMQHGHGASFPSGFLRLRRPDNTF